MNNKYFGEDTLLNCSDNINIVNGDIFSSYSEILIHQVHSKGDKLILEDSIINQIKIKHPEVYNSYINKCNESKDEYIIGELLYNKVSEKRIIASMFTLYTDENNNTQTNYVALELALIEIKNYAISKHKSITLPYYLGCNNGKGDWRIISRIIYNVFDKSNVYVEICKLL